MLLGIEHMLWCKTASQGGKKDDCVPLGTFGINWRYCFWLSVLGREFATGIEWDAAKYPTVPRTASCNNE